MYWMINLTIPFHFIEYSHAHAGSGEQAEWKGKEVPSIISLEEGGKQT
jgi:hypothetical protein